MCSSESVDGSRDVWSSRSADSSSANHLVVMVNGILGRYVTAFFSNFLFSNFDEMLRYSIDCVCFDAGMLVILLYDLNFERFCGI